MDWQGIARPYRAAMVRMLVSVDYAALFVALTLA